LNILHSCPISWTLWTWRSCISHSVGLESWLQFMLLFLKSMIWIANAVHTIGYMVCWMGMFVLAWEVNKRMNYVQNETTL
jgi:hypothetical protein